MAHHCESYISSLRAVFFPNHFHSLHCFKWANHIFNSGDLGCHLYSSLAGGMVSSMVQVASFMCPQPSVDPATMVFTSSGPGADLHSNMLHF